MQTPFKHGDIVMCSNKAHVLAGTIGVVVDSPIRGFTQRIQFISPDKEWPMVGMGAWCYMDSPYLWELVAHADCE